jgi:hypothetical protein
MVQQNPQASKNHLIAYKYILNKGRVFFTELLSSMNWRWFKIKYGSTFTFYGIQSKSKLAKFLMGEILTLMFEDIIENDAVYYYHRDKKIKFYIGKVHKKYNRVSLEESQSDISKINKFYTGYLIFPYNKFTYTYKILLPKILRKKLEEATIDGATYRDGPMEYTPSGEKYSKSSTKIT